MMKIAESPQQHNPEQISQELSTLVEQLKANVKTAAKEGDSFDSVERSVLTSVLRIGHQALELLLSLQGDGDIGEDIETANEQTARRSETKSVTPLRSIFGQHVFEQFTYSRGKNRPISLRPISARLSLPASRWSFLLQEFSQMLGVDQAYDQAMKNLGEILHSDFSVDTAERINGQLGRSAGEFLAALPVPASGSEGKFLIATADCKGVPLVKNDSQKVAAFETARKNPGNRRMATVTSVYSVDPHVRTAEEITAALFRDERDDDSPRAKRPKPRNKNTTAHFPESASDESGSQVAISGIQVGRALDHCTDCPASSQRASVDRVDGWPGKPLEDDAMALEFQCKDDSDSGHPARPGLRLGGCQFIREERLCSTCIYPKTIDENPAR